MGRGRGRGKRRRGLISIFIRHTAHSIEVLRGWKGGSSGGFDSLKCWLPPFILEVVGYPLSVGKLCATPFQLGSWLLAIPPFSHEVVGYTFSVGKLLATPFQSGNG